MRPNSRICLAPGRQNGAACFAVPALPRRAQPHRAELYPSQGWWLPPPATSAGFLERRLPGPLSPAGSLRRLPEPAVSASCMGGLPGPTGPPLGPVPGSGPQLVGSASALCVSPSCRLRNCQGSRPPLEKQDTSTFVVWPWNFQRTDHAMFRKDIVF